MSRKRFLWILALVWFASEYIVFALIPHRWFTLHFFRGAIVVVPLSLVFFGRAKLAPLRRTVSFNRKAACFHVAAAGAFFALELYLNLLPAARVGTAAWIAVALWLVLIPVVLLTGLASFYKLPVLVKTARSLGVSWIYAGICVVSVAFLKGILQYSWDTSSTRLIRILQVAAFNQSRWLLHFLYPIVIADPVSHVLGTPRFLIEVEGSCSGLEGLALTSVFIVLWLIFERRELRVFRAMLLAPVALCLMWILNVLRLVVLIMIGTAGHPDVAINGFHAQAGWICFNVVALGVLLVAQRIAWLHKSPASKTVVGKGQDAESENPAVSRNPAALYLGPFLAIIAASFLTQSVSGGFEWLYPLRFFAAAGVIFYFRKELSRLDWRCGWLGVGAGLGIAVLWIGMHYALTAAFPSVAPGPFTRGISALSPLQRFLWITFRLLAAVVTVPIAEELAFRGFLARRFASSDFETFAFSRLGVVPIVLSSGIFGLMHGHSWILGTIAGLAFALVARQRGRLGEAVGAHMAANFGLAIAVIVSGDYTLWS